MAQSLFTYLIKIYFLAKLNFDKISNGEKFVLFKEYFNCLIPLFYYNFLVLCRG